MPTEGESRSDAAVRERIRNLSDPDPFVRRMAAEDLGQIIDERAIDPLCTALLKESEESSVRVAVAHALGLLRFERAIPALRRAVQDRDTEVRETAKWALGYLRDPGVLEAQCLKLNDANPSIRMSAITLLGQIGDSRAIDPLITVLIGSEDLYSGGYAAVEALGRFGKAAVPSLTAALQHENAAGRSRVAMALGATRDETAVEPLYSALTAREQTGEVRERAAWALASIGNVAVPSLCAALPHEDYFVRLYATRALRDMRASEALDPLFLAFTAHEESREVRESASWALEKLGEPAVARLCSALQHEDLYVRYCAARVLGEIGDPNAFDALCASLQLEDWRDRSFAAKALGKLGDVRAVDPLCALLKDEDWQVRDAAANAVGTMGAAAVRPLCALLTHENVYTRRCASIALEAIGDADALPLQILSSPTLTPPQMRDALQALAAARPEIDGRFLHYAIGDVASFCANLCREASTDETVRRGASSVLLLFLPPPAIPLV